MFTRHIQAAALLAALPVGAGCSPPCPATLAHGEALAGSGAERTDHRIFRDLAMGVGWRCACLESGSVRCWRAAEEPATARTSVPFTGVESCTALAIDGTDLCVIDGGALVCADLPSAADGDAAPGEAIHASSPFIEGLPGDALAFDLRFSTALVVVEARGLWRASIHSRLEPPVQIFGFSDPVTVSSGGLSFCAVERDGTALCSGANARGQLGDGGLIDAPFAVPLAGSHHVSAIAVGTTHGCAVLLPAEVVCWGELTASLGRGYGPSEGSIEPDPSRAMSVGPTTLHLEARAVVTEGPLTCALTEDGGVYCWGLIETMTGGLRIFPTYTPQRLAELPGARQLTVSGDGVCAWSDQDLGCWHLDRGAFVGLEAVPQFASRPVPSEEVPREP